MGGRRADDWGNTSGLLILYAVINIKNEEIKNYTSHSPVDVTRAKSKSKHFAPFRTVIINVPKARKKSEK